jgi:arylsulfatase A-like enzyme
LWDNLPMKSAMARRDFLKVLGVLPTSLGLQPFLRLYGPSQTLASGHKNILIIVFDAFSAYNIPLYGYQRETTPNLSRLASRAIVYHNHFAAGNFTTPGTASLLTGTLPWTHGAIRFNSEVDQAFVHKTIFEAFSRYHRIVYSHNPLVNTFFKQFTRDLDEYVPQDRLFLTADSFVQNWFGNDEDIADVGWTRTIKKGEGGYSYSLFLSDLYKKWIQGKMARVGSRFPRGIPNIRGDNYFLLEDAIDFVEQSLARLPQPYLGYFHFLPPHMPTTTTVDFDGRFANDGYNPPEKPIDALSSGLGRQVLIRQRRYYDEYILYLDREFGRLFDYLDSSGRLENTWVVLTSDHGELLERGERGHGGPLMYQPVVRVPLLIFEPGRMSGMQINTPTSAIDVLPTLLHVSGESPAAWAEGVLLPPFGPVEPDPQRVVYALQATGYDADKALTHATAMMVQDRYKLTYYFGYKELGDGRERVQLFDIEADPEEMDNLFDEADPTAAAMFAALKKKLDEVNQKRLGA